MPTFWLGTAAQRLHGVLSHFLLLWEGCRSAVKWLVHCIGVVADLAESWPLGGALWHVLRV